MHTYIHICTDIFKPSQTIYRPKPGVSFAAISINIYHRHFFVFSQFVANCLVLHKTADNRYQLTVSVCSYICVFLPQRLAD